MRMTSPGFDAVSTCTSVENGRLRLPSPPAAASAFTYQVEADVASAHSSTNGSNMTERRRMAFSFGECRGILPEDRGSAQFIIAGATIRTARTRLGPRENSEAGS